MTGFAVVRDDDSAAFYDAAGMGTLLIRRCPVCATLYPPQQRRCADSEELEWVPASGAATLVTWAVDHTPPLDPLLAGHDATTSVFGWVQLAEGPWMQVAIVGADLDTLHEGTPMEVRFVQPGGGEAIPVFAPA